MPQVIVKKRKVKKSREGLERSRRIAKQVFPLPEGAANVATMEFHPIANCPLASDQEAMVAQSTRPICWYGPA